MEFCFLPFIIDLTGIITNKYRIKFKIESLSVTYIRSKYINVKYTLRYILISATIL